MRENLTEELGNGLKNGKELEEEKGLENREEQEQEWDPEYMKRLYLKVLERSYPNMTPEDRHYFSLLIREDGLGEFKLTFHKWGLIWGWLYLLYRRALIEGLGVLIISLLLFYISPLLGILANSLLAGFYYHFLYLNKFARDLEVCGEFNPDIGCMKRKGRPSIWIPIGVLFLFGVVIGIETLPLLFPVAETSTSASGG
ncbi:MAG: hypothetical protein ABGW77_02530 [Campylobacterales bacterium]